MVIPVAASTEDSWLDVLPGRGWSGLNTEEKHERILGAAGRVFAREGLDASMPAVAAEAGAGIGSLYRQFPSKQDLMSALVIRRLMQTQAEAAQAAAAPGDHWQATKEMLWATVERHAADDFLGLAWAQVEHHEQVQVAADATTQTFARLIDLARAEGGIRDDATAFDIRMLFTATRASRQIHPDAWKRVLELMIDGLEARHR
jgi:AcrR family transcriptional regulator